MGVESARRRDLFVEVLEEVREKHDFVIAGYVVMPEHFHLLISEPRIGKLSSVMQILKQRVSRRCRKKNRKSVDQMKRGKTRALRLSGRLGITISTCFANASMWRSWATFIVNPVKRGLVRSPELLRWSSFRDYCLGKRER